jgi:hypothetical protein
MENRRPITYSFEDIKRYKQGLMSREEMHAFEQASMEDPFLADALEGYMEADMALAETHISNIKGRISQKEEQKEKAVVVAMPQKRFALMRVAAMVIVIAGAGILTYKMFDKKDASADSSLAKVEKPADGFKTNAQPGAMLPATPADSGKTSQGVTSGNGHDNIQLNDIEKNTGGSLATIEPGKDKTANQGNVTNTREEREKELAIKPAKTALPILEEIKTDNVAASDKNGLAYKTGEVTSNQIRGRVISNNNQPMTNANIRLDNSRKIVTTDNAGNFTVVSPDSSVVATVETPGYMDTRVELKTNSSNTINLGSITLQPDASFNEIAVTGLGTEKKKQRVADTLTSKPEGGWESFQQYVADKLNIRLDTTGADMKFTRGELEIEFFVDANGVPKDFRVLNSTNPSLDQQAIEAVRQGPKWATRKKKARILIRY